MYRLCNLVIILPFYRFHSGRQSLEWCGDANLLKGDKMESPIAPVRATDESIKELNETLKENNRLTSEQNEKMLKYTRLLIVLTTIIAVLTVVLVFDFIFRIGRFGL